MSRGPGHSLPILEKKEWLLLFFGRQKNSMRQSTGRFWASILFQNSNVATKSTHNVQTTSRILGDWNYVISFNAHTILWNSTIISIFRWYIELEREAVSSKLVGGLRFEAAASSILVLDLTFPLKLPSQTKPFQPGKIMAASPRSGLLASLSV